MEFINLRYLNFLSYMRSEHIAEQYMHPICSSHLVPNTLNVSSSVHVFICSIIRWLTIRENAGFTFPFMICRLAYPVRLSTSLKILWIGFPKNILNSSRFGIFVYFFPNCSVRRGYVGSLHHSHFQNWIIISFSFVFYVYL